MTVLQMDAALITAYQALALGLATSYDGEEFTPPTDGSDWARCSQLPSGTTVRSLGIAGRDNHRGIFQIDYNSEAGSGRAVLLGYVQATLDQFVAGKGFTSGGQLVRIRSAERSSVREADGYQRATVSIFWEADSIRPAF